MRYYYHGTTLDRVQAIKSEGLQPNEELIYEPSYPDDSDSTKTYFTDDPHAAFAWAQAIRERTEDELLEFGLDSRFAHSPVILRVAESALQQFSLDPDYNLCEETDVGYENASTDGPCHEFEYGGSVGPEHIEVNQLAIESARTPSKMQVRTTGWTPISKFEPSDYVGVSKYPKMLHAVELYGNRSAVERALRRGRVT